MRNTADSSYQFLKHILPLTAHMRLPHFPEKQIEFIDHLKPAGALLFLENEETTFYHYMVATLSDLLLKQVLEIHTTRRKAHKRDKREQTYLEIKAGGNFQFYRPKPYEKTFISQCTEGKSRRLRFFLEDVFNESIGDARFKSQLINQLGLKHYFKDYLWFKLSKYKPLTIKGKETKQQLTVLISFLLKGLNPSTRSKPEDLRLMAGILGAKLFLFPGFEEKHWRNLCELFKKEKDSYTFTQIDEGALAHLKPSYYTPALYSQIRFLHTNVERLVSYHGVFSGVGDDGWGDFFF